MDRERRESTMFRENGGECLRRHGERSYPKKIWEINSRIRCFVGWGHSNCIVIEGETSLILVDAMDSDERSRRLKAELEKSGKPVKTLIYTHGHPDHRGGSGAFRDTVEEIIAFAPKRPVLKYTERLNGVLGKRTRRQFGYDLTEEECITQGIGIREGHAVGDGGYDFLAPTTLYREERVVRTIDGVPMELISAVGETDDQIFIWLPEDRVLCCGDNYYGCWPNLYAIRGGQYRDIAAWVDSLKEIQTYPAEALLPGHTLPILGAERIKEVLGNFSGAIEAVLLQTLDCMEKGMTESQTVEAVRLPDQYQSLPYLGEFYGTVDWSVRAIYHGYLGWFDGNPSNLNRLPDWVFAGELVDLAGAETILSRARQRLSEGDAQMAVQLCDLLLESGQEMDQAKELKAAGLRVLGERITSANGRHYYLDCAKELDGAEKGSGKDD